MTVDLAQLQPGDVMAVRGSGLAGDAIRLAGALEGEPDLDAHVIVVHHVTQGVLWGVQGQPGGVGWVDISTSGYVTGKAAAYTVSNAAQPKTSAQRALVCAAVVAALGVPYDWAAIGVDGLDALHLPDPSDIAAHATADLHLPDLWASSQWGSRRPGHVVCSSLAAWGNSQGGLAYPKQHPIGEVTPPDWTQFSLEEQWRTM